MTNALIPAISSGPFKATPTGLTVSRGDVPYEVWQAYGEGLERVEGAIQWVIGDWLNYGETRYGETYTQALELWQEEKIQKLRNYKWVSANVELSLRKDNLSWYHHLEVAKLEPNEQRSWLARAEAKTWTVRDLRHAIRGEDDKDRPWLRVYQVWNFQELDTRYGKQHPGQIPPQVMMNLNYYYTQPGDLVVDPFGGGGSTLDVCTADDDDYGGRKCRTYDIEPVRDDIKRWDVVKSGLPEFPHAKLLFLDPPYWKQKQGEYSAHETNMANLPLARFHNELEKIVRTGLKRADLVALIVGPTQENWELSDHGLEMVRRIGVPWKYISVPYSTQQHGGNFVNIAKENRQWLYLIRHLLIWKA